ncbi:AbrB family transcriptional regulator [Tropicibacter sp. Alg240-R139]|uniref:AbrB family transcriptional regulator n=1 Tax=Tropicibacter sp. Alg240-R139 TaxID=2305991 RepID=UPI0013E0B2C3|nr:AbrB family transcriptional regulator [Tropicibacter sp. Alg240-R139]
MSLPPRLATIAIAAIGAAVFWALKLPLPFLFGPMCTCLIAALTGVPLKGINVVSTSARTVLGIAVGSAITVDLMMKLPDMSVTLGIMVAYIVLIAIIGVPFFTRVCGFDRVTAYFSAMPGGLQDMILFGQEAGGNVRALSLIHVTRVLVIVSIAPFVLTEFYGVSLTGAVGAPVGDIPPAQLVLMVVIAIAGWQGGERLGLFGAAILGPLILGAVATLLGILTFRPPAEAIFVAQFVIGMGLGVSYTGITASELRHIVLSGIAFVIVLAVMAAGITQGVVAMGLADPVEAFLAFSPGGQAEMTVLALAVGADLGFVVLHHLVRMVVVIAGAPVAARIYLDEKE